MIELIPNKNKTLKFSLLVEGIDPSTLIYTLRLSDDNVEYGFIGENKNGEVVVTIPPLTSILNDDRIKNIKNIRLDVHDRSNKYFMMPFKDTVLIEKEPILSVKMTEEITENKIEVKMISEEDNVVIKPKKKPSSMISKFLEGK